MRVIRYGLVALCLLFGAANAAVARVNIDVNLSLFPELVRVPGYPVYYAPREDENYFFYDGMYWIYEDDGWYVSDWYNGPWEYVDPDDVPLFILRIPVRYYRHPPVYFRGWVYDEPPRWGQHWGDGWERNHRDWNHWDRRHSPAPAPVPDYQRHYSRDRYPDRDEQREIRDRSNYRYQPKDANVQPRYRESGEREPAQRDERNRQGEHNRQQDSNRGAAPQSGGWQGSSQRNGDVAQPQRQPQEQHENNWQRRIPVSESPRGQQHTERNEQSVQWNERGNSPHPAREAQEQRQQPDAARQHGGQEEGRGQRGDDDSRQDGGHGWKH